MTQNKLIISQHSLVEVFCQFFCFAGVGAIGTISHYLVLIALVRLTDSNPVVASTCGFVIGAFVNYRLNYRWTFRSQKKHGETMIKFFTVAVFGLFLNSGIMVLTTEIYSFHYFISQLFATGIVLLWNFAGNKIWTFKQAIY